ncbi:MAG: hypothetical protein KAH38_02640, partial [Candidatus Hydrogenedentes bacterium]|nr:hypothetical protein [Candidatus Hydrogenedentota bacterium]
MSGIIFVVLSITSALELYPAPQSAYMHEKKLFVIDSILPVVLQDETALPPYEPPDITPLYNALGYEPRLVSAALFDLGDEAIYIDIVSERSFFTKRSLRKYAPDPEESRPATYYLTINANGIFLAAVDRAGLHHGLYTLAQIISSSLEAGVNHRGIPAVPHLEIRDYPDMEIRAAYLHGPAARTHIQGYAALKCNMLIFESDDFYNLEGDRLLLWQEVFNEARQSGITPVPVFQIFNVPDVFLQQNPAAVEGRSRIDGLTLSSDDWAAFTQPNLIVTPENPIRVVVDERDMHFRSDYTVSEGGLNPPFLATYASPWMLRRIPGGSIPDGAATSVTYSYAPPQSTALCPHAPETRVLVRAALQRLIEGLEPAYIHGGGKEISRINQDLRCRNRNKTHGETFLEAITLVHDIAVEIKRDMGMMIWVDALLPVSVSSRDQKDFDLYAPLSGLPGGLLLLAEFDGSECFEGGRADAVLQWLDRHHMPRIGSVSVAEPASAYRIARQIGAGGELAKGMILRDANPLDDATRVLLGKIWSSNSQHLCWPEGLNDFFECTLWKPKFSELKEALL